MHIIRYTYPTARSLAPTTAFQGRSPWAGLESEIDRLFANALGEFSEPASGNTFPVEVRLALDRGVDVLFTSGGLGPTADDLTLAAVAEGTGRP